MTSGFILVDKEKNMTSQKVCTILKKTLNISKIGHTGTLDPNTTGLLVCALGQATKLMPLYNTHEKKYHTTILFGISTDSFDITGNILEENNVADLSLDSIDNAIKILKNQEFQTPPIYSAIKVDGKKLYEYARKNKEVELKKRAVHCLEAKRTSNLYIVDNYLCIDVYLHVSSGYYVRSFVNDLCNIIGVCGCMKELRRLSCGDFDVSNAFTLENIKDANYKILTIEELTSSLERVDVNEYLYKRILNGLTLDSRNIKTNKSFNVYYNNELIAIYKVVDEYVYKPLIILNQKE